MHLIVHVKIIVIVLVFTRAAKEKAAAKKKAKVQQAQKVCTHLFWTPYWCYVIVSLSTVGTEGTDETSSEISEDHERKSRWWETNVEDCQHFSLLHVILLFAMVVMDDEFAQVH